MPIASEEDGLHLRRQRPKGIEPRSNPRYAGVAGPVAQLDRALPSEGKGRAFESRRVRHFYLLNQQLKKFMICYIATIFRRGSTTEASGAMAPDSSKFEIDSPIECFRS